MSQPPIVTPTTTAPKCPQCGAPLGAAPVSRRITQRVYDPYMVGRYGKRGGQRVRTTEMEFCSGPCGAHYQMGCEG